ncbi:Plasmodium vivax Vir protein, putative [Plasmodium vivax]|uniref:Vir protein, putative n=1 Tax=Plasmodium vivax TaxID=5855 RepID=A0A1G4EC29_PLAVI|nr:Plasmodium vivax Vir protein, putative [Plasmodium vivax]
MTTPYTDKFYEELDKYDFVYDLPSCGFYSSLKVDNTHRSSPNQYCKSIQEGKHPDNCNLQSICINMENTLSQFGYEQCIKFLRNNNKCCDYLNYFIYSYIKSNDPCEDLDNLYAQLNKAKNVYFKSYSSCNIKKFDLNKEDFKKKKELYFHGDILYWIKEPDVFIKIDKTESFDKYLKKCYDIYTNIVQNYDCKSDKAFGSDLRVFRENFNTAMDYLKSKDIYISTYELKAPERSECALDNQTREGDDMDTDTQDATLNTRNIIRISTGITGGMSLLLFSLYKFTPFRYWLRRGSLRNKISQYNAEEKNHELFLNHSGYEHSNPNEIAYNVGYSS